MDIQGFTPTSRPQTNADVANPIPAPPEVSAATPPAFHPKQALERSFKSLNRHLDRMLDCSTDITKALKRLAADGVENITLADLVEQIQAKRTRSQMWALQLRQCGGAMAACMNALDETRRRQLDGKQEEILRYLKTCLDKDKPVEIAEALDASINSSNDFFEKLLELIDLIKNGYLAGYEHIIAAYSDFFADFNAEITAQMKDWVEGANDGKDVTLDAGALRAALTRLIEKYSHPNPASVLFPKPGEGGASKDEAEKWLKALSLPASCLKQNTDGTWCVVIDLGPLTTMKNCLPASGGTVTWDTAKYNQWQNGFNAQEERMKNLLQSLTQKYSNANSYHDNFNKTLSAHLNQFADMLRAMLNF
ncbi:MULTISPECIES: IpaD/SipD/SspD family type III secretion system needle tip protein [Pseudomonas]|uniref:IpaD/SipD/SspD family type III secretion system needle tip protein n=1 Tax=Pseudomonas TaxID=286 RepID=UPI001BEBCCC5|nr:MULTISPECIES: IpaD/SipD/SspD family type III secretion system needle tip protein [Pseudomonas]MBT2339703.1 IpaD/SipD/SspD family type III secretion system needle tip protein [Pseudomonas fluorescens]MCD4531225.1 IpaD/SipD/SspD family type III secretion system needle tip protein [Pseudomonas sp. C3-2018]